MEKGGKKMTLIEAVRKICNMINVDPNLVSEVYFFDMEYTKGIFIKSDIYTVIVPDINNCERIFQYEKEYDKSRIALELTTQGFSQRDVGRILRCSQGTVSRMKK